MMAAQSVGLKPDPTGFHLWARLRAGESVLWSGFRLAGLSCGPGFSLAGLCCGQASAMAAMVALPVGLKPGPTGFPLWARFLVGQASA